MANIDIEAQREAWRKRQVHAAAKTRPRMGGVNGKGIGPNKACGHKGGICRQGSKRG